MTSVTEVFYLGLKVIHTDTKLHLVMEYASGGELFTKLSSQGMMNENDAKIVFAQILSAVQHMVRCYLLLD